MTKTCHFNRGALTFSDPPYTYKQNPKETLAPHHGLCHKRFLSPGPVRLPWVGCQATVAALTCTGEGERERAGDTSCQLSENDHEASVWGDGFVHNIPLSLSSSVCLSLAAARRSRSAQLVRDTHSAAGVQEEICYTTDHVEQTGASTTSAEVPFIAVWKI